MQQYSTFFIKNYDMYLADRSLFAKKLHSAIKKYHKGKVKNVLEIACGTGTILQTFPPSTHLFGLDISKEMIALAKKKLPSAKLYHADMTNFQLYQTFDVIYCMGDSLNHLLHFSDWKKTFKQVYNHLSPNGLFIFDMNSLNKLEEYTKSPHAQKLDTTHFLYGACEKKTKGLYCFTFLFFSLSPDGTMTVKKEQYFEKSFDVDSVSTALSRYYKVLGIQDFVKKRLTKKPQRLLFICKKI